MARADIHSRTEKETTELISYSYKLDNDIIEVVLSERNLLSLLAKLHINESKRTIYNGDVPKGYVLKLVSEDDETHYAGESRKGASAGGMHPDTEELVAALKETIKEWEANRNKVLLFHKAAEATRGDAA